MATTFSKSSDGRSTKISISPSGISFTEWQIFSNGQSISDKPTSANPYPFKLLSTSSKPGNVSVLSTGEISVWLPPNQTFQIRYRLDGGSWTALESFTSIGYFNSYDRYLSLI